jgi:large subunit ribosomal protein L29
MKTKRFNEEIRQLDENQLNDRLNQLKKELFSLRLNVVTSHVKDYSVFTKLRRDIARVRTIIVEKAQAQQSA